MHGATIDAYILSTWDEHLNEDISDHDKRIQFISGFSGKFAHVVITKHLVALWTDEKYLTQANSEMNCDWKIFSIHSSPSVIEYLMVKTTGAMTAIRRQASHTVNIVNIYSILFNAIQFSTNFQSIAIVLQIQRPRRIKSGWNGKPNYN